MTSKDCVDMRVRVIAMGSDGDSDCTVIRWQSIGSERKRNEMLKLEPVCEINTMCQRSNGRISGPYGVRVHVEISNETSIQRTARAARWRVQKARGGAEERVDGEGWRGTSGGGRR